MRLACYNGKTIRFGTISPDLMKEAFMHQRNRKRKRRKTSSVNRRIIVITILIIILFLTAVMYFAQCVLKGKIKGDFVSLGPGEIVQETSGAGGSGPDSLTGGEAEPVNLTGGEPAPGTSGTKETAVGETQFTEPEILWNLMLVNRWNPIPENYEPKLAEVPGGEMVDDRIYSSLMEMLAAAEAQNLGPIVVAGYRTEETQQSLYNEKVQEYTALGYSENEAKEMTEQWVAIPGTSEHQLGLAVDINGATYDIYPWLQENSYKYGFIFRYPGAKTEITGVAEEVWHYRYVGKEAAREMYEQGICLEEYLEKSGFLQ